MFYLTVFITTQSSPYCLQSLTLDNITTLVGTSEFIVTLQRWFISQEKKKTHLYNN